MRTVGIALSALLLAGCSGSGAGKPRSGALDSGDIDQIAEEMLQLEQGLQDDVRDPGLSEEEREAVEQEIDEIERRDSNPRKGDGR